MLGFILLAATLTVAVVALVAVPLLRARTGGPAPAPWSALAAAGVIVVGSALLYVTWSNWPWHAPPPADSPERMVANLARSLERNPDNLEGWLMLGRSYIVLQEYPLAYRAYERADRLSGGRNADALTGEAEALAMNDRSELDTRAGRLIERALAIAPDSGKALFFGAAVAARRGDLPLARQRFEKLLAMNPPETLRKVLEQQVAEIDRRLAGGSAAAPAAGAAAGDGAPEGAAGTQAARAAAPAAAVPASAAGTPIVRVRITLAAGLGGSAGASPLFVFVRDPGRPGPPLAARRLASQFPQTVELSPRDSMIPGRAFTAGQSVEVVARIARSGNPVGASGDPFGAVTYQVGRDGLANLVIDRLTP
jgi:cytochrome c-type biogenesis protein CcmH